MIQPTKNAKLCFVQHFSHHFPAPQVHCDSMAEELSAAGSLLRVTCDAVIELDPKLCLTNHSPELSAMLLRDRPGSTLRGKSFLELMPPEEAGPKIRKEDFWKGNIFRAKLVSFVRFWCWFDFAFSGGLRWICKF